MMHLAAQIGIAINDFWYMTPAEIGVYAEGYSERLTMQVEIDLRIARIQAYLTSRWVWQKHVNLEQFENKTKQPAEMSDDQMMVQVMAINAQMGGQVIRKSEGGA